MMMRKLIACTAIVGIGLSFSSCQHSPRKNYFILTVPSMAENPAPNTGGNVTQVIGIGPIEIADFLNRSPVVYTQDNNALTISDNDYWGEPLDKGVARVIAANLTQRNGARSVANFPWRSDSKPAYSLRVQIHNLTRSNNEASINATWQLIDNNTKVNLQHRNFIHSTNAGTGTQALAQAYSKLLADLAVEMDEALNKLP